jgi:hypothetical protein
MATPSTISKNPKVTLAQPMRKNAATKKITDSVIKTIDAFNAFLDLFTK